MHTHATRTTADKKEQQPSAGESAKSHIFAAASPVAMLPPTPIFKNQIFPDMPTHTYPHLSPLSVQTQHFIDRHRHDDVHRLALHPRQAEGVDLPAAMAQIAGWQTASTKLPGWAEIPQVRYPRHLSLEQCSSQLTARYKAELLRGDSLADLTGGFGVDTVCLAAGFSRVDYVEQQPELCALAAHNFPLLGAGHVAVHCDRAEEYLAAMEPVQCIFLDPARRDGHGGKTVAIADCEPDVARLEELLLQKAERVAVKLSPMLDVALALRELPRTQEVHVVSVQNECKELLLLMGREGPGAAGVAVHCINLVPGGEIRHFTFYREAEAQAPCRYAPEVGAYLYEPHASILKAGAFRSIADAYGVEKLHASSHLYTSQQAVEAFPGRRFRVVGQSGFGKRELRTLLQGIEQANLTVRNFPDTVARLRKRLHLAEGGEVYLFATTLADGRRVLLHCRKA